MELPFHDGHLEDRPALAAGNTVVLKPASVTPLTTLVLGRLAQEAGLPAGVLNVITGPGEVLGEALVKDPEVAMVSLTGGSVTGKRIMEMAASALKRVHLELGGKAAFIVYEDADLDAAARGAAVASYVNTGQDCTAGTRIYAHEAIYQDLRGEAEGGDGGGPHRRSDAGDDDMGPMISAAQRDRVEGFVKRARAAAATLVTGGARPSGLTAASIFSRPCWRRRTRKPRSYSRKCSARSSWCSASPVRKRSSRKPTTWHTASLPQSGHAISTMAMNTSKALSFGTVWINDHLPLTSEMPHGGFKQSGFGKDLSTYAMEEYYPGQARHGRAER